MGSGDRSSRALHNFSLPPRLNWGSQRLLHCASNTRRSQHQRDQILAIREKLMLDLTSQVDKFRSTFLGNNSPQPPWNLRTRRSPANEEVSPSPVPVSEVISGGGERPKFSMALSKQEIEEDFVRMVGRRPHRKAKKRPRYIQKQLDNLFPGLWLTEITADMYSVNENPENPK